MKNIKLLLLSLSSSLIISLFSSSVIANAVAMDIAVEMSGIRMEYMKISDTGLIYVKGCDECKQRFYKFSKQPQIYKDGKKFAFKEFMVDYWKAQYPTLILDKNTLEVLKVIY